MLLGSQQEARHWFPDLLHQPMWQHFNFLKPPGAPTRHSCSAAQTSSSSSQAQEKCKAGCHCEKASGHQDGRFPVFPEQEQGQNRWSRSQDSTPILQQHRNFTLNTEECQACHLTCCASMFSHGKGEGGRQSRNHTVRGPYGHRSKCECSGEVYGGSKQQT
jgi:hypothetical protein